MAKTGRADFRRVTRMAAGFVAAALLGSACATDMRYHEAALGAVSDADRKQCEQLADAARAQVRTHSLGDLTAEDWGAVTAYAGTPLLIVMFEMRRMNSVERQRAYEAALQDCLQPLFLLEAGSRPHE